MYLSYSGFKKHDGCPRLYWHGYIDKTPLPAPDNRVGMLYGDSMGKLFESFYKDRLWRGANPERVLLDRAETVVRGIVRVETERGGVFNWSDPNIKMPYDSVESVIEDVKESIPRGVSIIRHHRLVGINNDTELKLDTVIAGHKFGGRADFSLRRLVDGDTILADGKGSRHREQYVDRRQLKWYAMLYRQQFHTLPDRLGFIYWRSEPENSVDWIECTDKDVDILLDASLASIRSIEEGKKRLLPVLTRESLYNSFPARPSRECKLCSYKTVCPDGAAFLTRKMPPVSRESGVEDVQF